MFSKHRLLKRDLNRQERASDTGMKSAAMGIIPFVLNNDLKTQLQTFGTGGGDTNWIEMVRGVYRHVFLLEAVFTHLLLLL